MKDLKASVTELLVATNVTICQSVYQHLQPVHEDQKPIGKLHLLSVPNTRWETISIDFIVELLESMEFDSVMTIVDSVSKTVYFIPTHTMVSMEGVVRLFLHGGDYSSIPGAGTLCGVRNIASNPIR